MAGRAGPRRGQLGPAARRVWQRPRSGRPRGWREFRFERSGFGDYVRTARASCRLEVLGSTLDHSVVVVVEKKKKKDICLKKPAVKIVFCSALHSGKMEIFQWGETDPTRGPHHWSPRGSATAIHTFQREPEHGRSVPGLGANPLPPTLISKQIHGLPALCETPEKGDFRRTGRSSQERKCSLQTPAAAGKKINIYIYKNICIDIKIINGWTSKAPVSGCPAAPSIDLRRAGSPLAGPLPAPLPSLRVRRGHPRDGPWPAPAHTSSTRLVLARGGSIYPM